MVGNECYRGKTRRIRRREWEGRCERVREVFQKGRETGHREAGVLTPALLVTYVRVAMSWVPASTSVEQGNGLVAGRVQGRTAWTLQWVPPTFKSQLDYPLNK